MPGQQGDNIMSAPVYRYLRYRDENGVLVVTPTPAQLRDEDLANAVREDLIDLVSSRGPAKVVLDLQCLQEMSSVGLWPLLRLHHRLKEQGGNVVLCNVQPGVAEVLHATRLVSSSGAAAAPFEDVPDEAAALARLSS